jgi:hypothetical protein
MDKTQKQLVDSYLRKRKIANETADDMGSRFEYKTYEVAYFLENKLMTYEDIKGKIGSHQAIEIFSQKPEFADDPDIQKLFYDFGPRRTTPTNEINTTTFIEVLEHQARFARTEFFKKAYKEKFYKLETDLIAKILNKNPKLAYEPNFAPYIKELNLPGHDDDLVNVLTQHPEIANKFNLKTIRVKYAMELLMAQPQFIDSLNLQGKITDYDIYLMEKYHPELVPKLKKMVKNG